MITNDEFDNITKKFNEYVGNMACGTKFWNDNCVQLTARWFVDMYNRNLSQMHYEMPNGKKLYDYLDVFTNQSWSPIVKLARDYETTLKCADTYLLNNDPELLTESIKATGMRQYPYLGIYIAQCMLNDNVPDEKLTLEDFSSELKPRYSPNGQIYYSSKK